MHRMLLAITFAGITSLPFGFAGATTASDANEHARGPGVQLGTRPFFLVNDMTDSSLKRELLSCAERKSNFSRTDFSMGHRGLALQFPDHTKEAYEAAARAGAGFVECGVTFTKDKALVCREAQDDLHTTTNILETPLAAKCSIPFTPALIDGHGNVLRIANAECRTSDITLAEFKTLRGKMDGYNPYAQTVAEYIGENPAFPAEKYPGPNSGTLLSHQESIALFTRLGVKMAPELKIPAVPMPFKGFTQEAYAQKMIDEYKAAGVAPRRVRAQSFNKSDVLYWIAREPAFGAQAVYLRNENGVANLPGLAELAGYKASGINRFAPPLFTLLTTDASGSIVPSQYALDIKKAGLKIITWTLENSGIFADDDYAFFYQTIDSAIKREGDMMVALDVLAKQVGILSIFSHQPATVTYYANCMGLE